MRWRWAVVEWFVTTDNMIASVVVIMDQFYRHIMHPGKTRTIR
jgi:hypothetical protein